MKPFAYKRFNVAELARETPAAAAPNQSGPGADHVRWWIIPASILLCCIQAGLTIIGDHVNHLSVVSTLIPVTSFAVLFLLVLLVNPMLAAAGRGGRIFQRLNRIELTCVFTALFATAGLATFGMAAHLVPLIAGPWNPEWNTPQSGWRESLTRAEAPLLNPKLYLSDAESVRLFREGLPIHAPPEDAPLAAAASYYRDVALAVPWSEWVGPLGFWLVFLFACMAVFYSLSFIVLRSWADREKLIFPLAQLPQEILPGDKDVGVLPRMLCARGFWLGFAVSGLVLSWNAAVGAGWILEEFAFPLGMRPGEVTTLLHGSALEGLIGGNTTPRVLVIFTAIGIAFLLPVQISFSTWFYFLVAQVMVLCAVWVGVAQNASDFPSDFFATPSFLTAQGGGALLVFAAISLFRALRGYLDLVKARQSSGFLHDMAPVLWFMGSAGVMLAWLLWTQVPLLWALVFILVFTLITTGMMRIVAETGIYYAQMNFGLFHLFHAFGIGKLAPGAMVAPLLPMYSIFLMDIKTFVAPNLLNSAKIQKDVGSGRRMFHCNMILCIILSSLFAIAFMIFLTYERGGQQMNNWFYNYMPLLVLNEAESLVSGSARPFSENAAWTLVGAGWLCLSLWIRQSLFWFPHPIGYILFFNPLMSAIWLSFFIGWLLKRLVVKYGGKSTFDRVKPICIGLIMGELMAIFVWMALGHMLGFSSGIDLNR